MDVKQLPANQTLDQLLINLMQKKQSPDTLTAMTIRHRYSIKHNYTKPLFFGQPYQQFGPGVALYFGLLKYLSFLFFFLFLNSLPSIICNFMGNGLEIYQGNQFSVFKITIMKASLANLPLVNTFQAIKLNQSTNESIEQNQSNKSLQQIYSKTSTNRLITTLNDIYLTIIILMFMIYWQIKSKRIMHQTTKTSDLPSFRTLLVSQIFQKDSTLLNQIPPQQLTSRRFSIQSQNIQQKWQQKIRKHFSKFGQVDAVTIVYDYQETLYQLTQFNYIVRKYANQEDGKIVLKLYQFLKARFQQIQNQYLINTQNNVKMYQLPFLPKKALVTFHSKEDRNRVKNLYKYKVNVEQLKFQLGNMSQNEEEGNLPQVRSFHTEPVSIMWENFHRKKTQDIKTTFFIGGFLCFILYIALIAVLLLSIKMAGLKDTILHQNSSHSISANDGQTIQFPSYLQALHTKNIQTLYNFCSNIKLSYDNLHLQYYTLCQQYFTNFSQRWLTMLALSSIILAINLLLNKIIYHLVEYRRHRTVTQRNRFLVINIFMVYFTNMVLLILLIRADFSAEYKIDAQIKISSLIDIIKHLFPQFQAHRKIETYSEFNRKWYIHIGNQLLFNYLLSLIVCPWLYIIEFWIFQKAYFFMAKWKGQKQTQTQLNQMLQAQKFDFQTYYAMSLSSFFFCMTFATGIPLFYLMGAISFLSLFASSSIIFYYFCKIPDPFDHTINKLVCSILVVGLAIHQIMAIFFLYVEDIFPVPFNNYVQSVTFQQKFKKGWIFLLTFSLIVIFGIFKKQICKIIQKKCFTSQKKVLTQQHMMQQQQQIQQMDQKIIQSSSHFQPNNLPIQSQAYIPITKKYFYRMQDNPIYSNIYYTLTVFHKIVYHTAFPSDKNIKMDQNYQERESQQDEREREGQEEKMERQSQEEEKEQFCQDKMQYHTQQQ